MPLVHLLGVGQLGRCPLTAAAQAPFVSLYLSPEDGQLDLLVIDLEAMVSSTKASRIASANLGV